MTKGHMCWFMLVSLNEEDHPVVESEAEDDIDPGDTCCTTPMKILLRDDTVELAISVITYGQHSDITQLIYKPSVPEYRSHFVSEAEDKVKAN